MAVIFYSLRTFYANARTFTRHSRSHTLWICNSFVINSRYALNVDYYFLKEDWIQTKQDWHHNSTFRHIIIEMTVKFHISFYIQRNKIIKNVQKLMFTIHRRRDKKSWTKHFQILHGRVELLEWNNSCVQTNWKEAKITVHFSESRRTKKSDIGTLAIYEIKFGKRLHTKWFVPIHITYIARFIRRCIELLDNCSLLMVLLVKHTRWKFIRSKTTTMLYFFLFVYSL